MHQFTLGCLVVALGNWMTAAIEKNPRPCRSWDDPAHLKTGFIRTGILNVSADVAGLNASSSIAIHFRFYSQFPSHWAHSFIHSFIHSFTPFWFDPKCCCYYFRLVSTGASFRTSIKQNKIKWIPDSGFRLPVNWHHQSPARTPADSWWISKDSRGWCCGGNPIIDGNIKWFNRFVQLPEAKGEKQKKNKKQKRKRRRGVGRGERKGGGAWISVCKESLRISECVPDVTHLDGRKNPSFSSSSSSSSSSWSTSSSFLSIQERGE